MPRSDEIEGLDAARATRVFVTDVAYFDERAAGLVDAHAAGVKQALAQIRAWHPRFVAASDGELRRSRFELDDARIVYARQHGCADWPALIDHAHAIANGVRSEPFRDAFEAVRARQWDRLSAVIAQHPDVLRARGTNGNTLLNLAVSVAGAWCGKTAAESARWLDLLLDAGADVDTPNDRGWTPLHQAGYSDQARVAARLIAAGAAVDREAHGEGGTPLAVALFWGNREVSEVLAAAGVVPNNLRIAAGLGRADLVAAAFAPDGSLTPAARAGRGFHRPHSGFPIWQPSDHRQEILDEALVWAAKSDRVEVMPLLVAQGANVNGDPYRGTPLLWASWKSRLAAAHWLLDHGAEVSRRATFGGPGHGQGVTALHLAAQCDHAEMARLLLERGADTSITDELYESTPAGWAGHFGAARVGTLLSV